MTFATSPTTQGSLSSNEPSDQQLIPFHSQMADRIRSHHWSGTPLGAIDTWSQEMLSTVNLMLAIPTFAVVFWGPDYLVIHNDAFLKTMDDPAVLGQPVREVWPLEWPTLDAKFAAAYREGQSIQWTESIETAKQDGTIQKSCWDCSLSPVYVKGQVKGLLKVGQDTTEKVKTCEALKHARELLLQNEKLAAVGRLASSIAHEINNPLESVTNLLYLARTSEDGQQQEYLDTAEHELRRVSAISNQTLRFHKQSSSPREVTCDDLLATVLAIHQGRLLNSRIELRKGPISPKPILCFDGEIRQVLSNLVGNAIDALLASEDPRVHLMIRSREATDWHSERRGLRVTIADTGGGIEAKSMEHIFDPFFTTKGMAGTGLGLWVSREIVERHKGNLRVRSSQRKGYTGTVFTLFLPFDAVVR
jgi:signal transduction histidine kinase